jgi:hypothetical protein
MKQLNLFEDVDAPSRYEPVYPAPVYEELGKPERAVIPTSWHRRGEDWVPETDEKTLLGLAILEVIAPRPQR